MPCHHFVRSADEKITIAEWCGYIQYLRCGLRTDTEDLSLGNLTADQGGGTAVKGNGTVIHHHRAGRDSGRVICIVGDHHQCQLP